MQVKEKKDIPPKKKEVKLSLFAESMIWYLETIKECTHTKTIRMDPAWLQNIRSTYKNQL